MPFLEATANKILNKILKATDFTAPTGLRISLHTADPGQNGANEVLAGAYSYVRVAPTIGAVATKACTNTAVLTWDNMPAVTVTHAGLWDIAGTPVFWWKQALTASKVVAADYTFEIPIGDLDFLLT